MTYWHIAQLNVATARYDLEDPHMDGFMSQLDDINALADSSSGFVWRLQSESGNATDIQVQDAPRLIVNMSVWESVDALFDFAYRSAHRQVLTRRREWFTRPEGPYQVLWWVSSGHEPTVDEGLERLKRLAEDGPTAHAFSFKSSFPPPSEDGDAVDLDPAPYCSGWD
ncbi:MAG: DUF3291 domain-containing protein [Pseudomonadota bacterium]